ncbi:MAG: sugar ABC transporter substrate-binding protein [Spirochaetaceae bacterium]|nr:sugar ABC transporter substrate-binding protein [Spirochaetaceae bacterium]
MNKKTLAIVLISALILPLFAQGQKEGSTKQEEIRVMLANHPYGDLLKEKIPEFEAATGIKVNVEQLQESQLTQQLTTEFATGSSTVDVFMTRPLQEGLLFMKNGWYTPLMNYDFSDYPQSTIDIGAKDGSNYIIPLVTEWEVLYYRKDLMKKAGLTVPKTLAELEIAAKALNKDGVAGIASRGKGAAGVTQMSSYLYNFGGRYLENGHAVFNTPEALEAIKYYGRINSLYGPTGITSMSWENIMPIFQAGKVAMWTDASVFYGTLINPEKSVVAKEDVGVAAFPVGPKANNPFIVVSWGMSIAKSTKHMSASEKFIEWATSAAYAKEGMLTNITMARNSAWTDPDVLKVMNSGLVESQASAAKNGYPYDRPYMSSVGAARDLIGEVIIESIDTAGNSSKLQSLADAKVESVNKLLQTDGEYQK